MLFKNERAFTLIEVLIVLAILGALAAVGVQHFQRNESLKTALRQMSTVMKKTRAFAKLRQKTYRLVLKRSAKEPHSYWVEISQTKHLIDPKDSDKYRLTMDKEKDEEKLKAQGGGFQPAGDILKSPKALPSEWSFDRIESSGHPEVQDNELNYIYFFPEGVSEEAIVQFTNKKKSNTWTMHLNPLLSNPDIFQEAKSLKDFAQ